MLTRPFRPVSTARGKVRRKPAPDKAGVSNPRKLATIAAMPGRLAMSLRAPAVLGVPVVPAFALVLLTVAVFAPALTNGFVWDDAPNITESPTVRTWDGLRRNWTDPYANQQYYPLTHTSFWIQYQLFGLRPAPYIALNILLQAVAAVLLWRVLRRLEVPGAWFAAALFAVHPLQVESVAWITERKNLLAGVLLFAATLAFLRWSDAATRRGARAVSLGVLAVVLFFLAVAAKSAVATAPAALLVVLWWTRGRVERRDAAVLAPMFAIGVAAGLVTAALERHHVGAGGEAWSFSVPDRVVLAGRVAWFYLGKLGWPGEQLFIYPRWEVSAQDPVAWIAPLAALTTLAGLWLARRRLGRGPLAAALVYGLLIAPASGFFDVYFFQFSFVQDHFQYFACVAPLALAAAAATTALRSRDSRPASAPWYRARPAWLPAALAAVVLLAAGATSVGRLSLFKDNATLWSRTLEKNKDAWIASYNLGLIRAESGRTDEALALYDAALRANPDLVRAHHNKGVAYERLGRVDEAARSYARAIEIDPGYAGSRNNLGQIEARRGRAAEALAHFEAAVAAEPGFGVAWFNRGSVLAATGRFDEAAPALREALRLEPGLVPAYEQLARVLVRLGRVAEARELLQTCRQRAGNPDPRLARAVGL